MNKFHVQTGQDCKPTGPVDSYNEFEGRQLLGDVHLESGSQMKYCVIHGNIIVHGENNAFTNNTIEGNGRVAAVQYLAADLPAALRLAEERGYQRAQAEYRIGPGIVETTWLRQRTLDTYNTGRQNAQQ